LQAAEIALRRALHCLGGHAEALELADRTARKLAARPPRTGTAWGWSGRGVGDRDAD
jgi:hypothetical protein